MSETAHAHHDKHELTAESDTSNDSLHTDLDKSYASAPEDKGGNFLVPIAGDNSRNVRRSSFGGNQERRKDKLMTEDENFGLEVNFVPGVNCGTLCVIEMLDLSALQYCYIFVKSQIIKSSSFVSSLLKNKVLAPAIVI